MKNAVIIKGDIALVELPKKHGKKLVTVISAADLPIVSQVSGYWRAWFTRSINGYYVAAYQNQKPVFMHRLIMDAPEGYVVDHINHDTLDNRRQNLRIVTFQQNCQNRRGAQTNNRTSGVRGVTWHKKSQKWQARVKVNGRYRQVGLFKELHEAAAAVADARSRWMPYSQEASARGEAS